jgi:acyl carrier protein
VAAQLDTDLRERVVERMRELLPRILGTSLPAVAEGTGLMDELGLRSTTTLELLLLLEETLDIEIDVEDIEQGDLKSVGDLADFVASHATPAE